MNVRAVFLDAGGVFFLPEATVLRPALEAVGVMPSDADLVRAHYHGMRGWDGVPELDAWAAYNRGFAQALDADRDEVRRAVGAAFADVGWTDVITESVEALPALSEAVEHLAVVSNSTGIVEDLFVANGIAQRGDGDGVPMVEIIDSHIVGVEKPDPAIFKLALEVTGVDAAEAIHVGDSLKADVRGAEAAGVRPVHMDPYGLCHDRSHVHVAELREVLNEL